MNEKISAESIGPRTLAEQILAAKTIGEQVALWKIASAWGGSACANVGSWLAQLAPAARA